MARVPEGVQPARGGGALGTAIRGVPAPSLLARFAVVARSMARPRSLTAPVGRLRAYYFDAEIASGTPTEAWALGGWVGSRTPRWGDFFQDGAAF